MLVIGAGCEEQRIPRPARGRAAAEGEPPEAVDDERRTVGGVELAALLIFAVVLGRPGVEGVDLAVAEVSDEQVTAKEPEVGRSEREPPRRIELFLLEATRAEQLAGGVEGVTNPCPLPGTSSC
jgi:hypothetical protein